MPTINGKNYQATDTTDRYRRLRGNSTAILAEQESDKGTSGAREVDVFTNADAMRKILASQYGADNIYSVNVWPNKNHPGAGVPRVDFFLRPEGRPLATISD